MFLQLLVASPRYVTFELDNFVCENFVTFFIKTIEKFLSCSVTEKWRIVLMCVAYRNGDL